MPIRTTSAAVIAILGSDYNYNSGDDLSPFIETASNIIDSNCIYVAPLTPYSDTKLELIERWLSGWAYLLMNPARKFDAAGPVQKSTESKVDLNFALNKYGQTAMLLDTNGGLAELNNSLKSRKQSVSVGITWLGKSYVNTD